MEGTQRMEHVAGWIRALVRCGIGGAAYYVLELTWRGHSHWTMAVLGGILFVLLGDIARRLGGNVPLWAQGMLGAALVTEAELSAGIWLNLIWRLDIWDYSRVPFNLLGQICLPYTLLWLPVSMLAIRLDGWLRRRLFRESAPFRHPT